MLKLTNKIKLIIGIVIIILTFGTGYCLGKKLTNPRIITKIEVREKIIEKIITLEVEKKDEKKHIVKKIIERPDGTKETIIEEKTEVISETSKKNHKDTVTETKTKIDEKVAVIPSQYRASGLAIVRANDIKSILVDYGAIGEMRVLGPFWAGVGFTYKQKAAIISVSVEF